MQIVNDDDDSLLSIDSSLKKEIEDMRKIVEEEKEKSIEKNKDLIGYYEVYLDYIIDELLKYNFISSLDYSIALSYLISHGYLSNGLVFRPGEVKFEVFGKHGISIVDGSGCCRHVSSMHKDVLEKLGFNIIPFYCFLGDKPSDYKKVSLPNHLINLITYDENLYGIDLNNGDGLYHFKDSFIMKNISDYNKKYLRYSLVYDLVFEGLSLNAANNRQHLFKYYSKIEPITSVEYEFNIRKNIYEVLLSNRKELNKFHNKTKTLRKEITSRMFFDD